MFLRSLVARDALILHHAVVAMVLAVLLPVPRASQFQSGQVYLQTVERLDGHFPVIGRSATAGWPANFGGNWV
jgi:hypothetical protein